MIGIILKNWQYFVMMALALALAGMYAYSSALSSKINVLEAEKKTLKMELAVAQASVKTLRLAIDEQNASIEKLKAENQIRQSEYVKEITKARAKSASLKKQAEDILIKIQPANTSSCDAANLLINEEIAK